MHWIDWIVMVAVLAGIIAYGVWKTRSVSSMKSYLMGDRELHWWTIGLSVMATQASAITFLSTPGQAYDDGMRFVQFYLGLPIAMILLVIFVLPIYYRLNVYTAYEYLEGRFDLKTRTLAAVLFLFSRGMAAGFTISAPSIVLASIMGWNLQWTIILTGSAVTFYTVFGGTKAVSVTQQQQMTVILLGLVATAFIIVSKFPQDVSFTEAVGVANVMGKMDALNFKFDWADRYNVWSGIIASTFLFLSYFGTDQSQVQRYLSGRSLKESQLGLLFNGFIKLPMQYFVLFTGILVFLFFMFVKPPVHFNKANLQNLESADAYRPQLDQLKQRHDDIFQQKEAEVKNLVGAMRAEDQPAINATKEKVMALQQQDNEVRSEVDALIKTHAEETGQKVETNDKDYIFITFVVNYLPKGMIGLLLAVIFCAAMSSIASELNALATTTVVDIYRRSMKQDATDHHYLSVSKWLTVAWGALVIMFASITLLFENLIQAVNIVGSLLYGTILGIFMVAFTLKRIGGTAVFISALIGEAVVVGVYWWDKMDGVEDLGFLWLNPIGCGTVVLCSLILQALLGKPDKAQMTGG
ncbi:MAG: sodium:solute symporter [Lewinellaceae bacterium]|nr:sodium:solute symporter [Saprospiraceae bacterium]MCB9339849.1 sodium:solute symporter [Lewinellaceae bacterium]